MTTRLDNLDANYKDGFQAGIAESVKRIESFKNRVVLQMRISTSSLSDAYYQFACKLVDAEIKLLNMQGTKE